MQISFNLRLGYHDASDCVNKMDELGGQGGVVVGGSVYTGTMDQIDQLIQYMEEKNYDLDGMAINEDPREATERRLQELMDRGIICNTIL